MRGLLTSFGIGLVSGILSGAFGIGGGIITTPGIRLLLGAPALVAVGTPLPVIFPSAVTGLLSYRRQDLLEVRTGLWCGAIGSAFTVLGALATQFVGGTVVLLATAALILYTAADMILQMVRPPRLGLEASEERDAFSPSRGGAEDEGSASQDTTIRRTPRPQPAAVWKLALIGALTGAYSGFLGLGGGFVLVPMLSRWLGYDIKRAIGTSLLAIAILAVPGTITHALMGHVDWLMAATLIVGVVPGAWLGSRVTLGSSDRAVWIGFAVMLVAVGGWLAAAELGWLPR
jgi:uncharacterized membrane protein YfcA